MIKRIKLNNVNKKAQTGSVVQDFIAAIAILFLLFIFYIFSTIIFNLEKKDFEIRTKNQALLLEKDSIYWPLLNLNYEIEGEKLTIKEIARLAENDLKYKTILEDKISEIKSIYPEFKLEEII